VWLGTFGAAVGLGVYVAPMTLWLATATVIAAVETRHTYDAPRSVAAIVRRAARVVPYVLINTGMLAHQVCAFTEGLFGPLHSEFERTPKAATVTSSASGHASPVVVAGGGGPRRAIVRVHRPYVAAEVFFVLHQLGWAAVFVHAGMWASAAAAAFVGACATGLLWFTGDHAGMRLLVLPVGQLRSR
jgi:hypothetical protein